MVFTIVTTLWILLAGSLTVACVSAYFYWFSGNTTIRNMLGFYVGTGLSILFFAILLIAKLFFFLS